MKLTTDNTMKIHNLLTGFASGLRKIRSVVDELGDLGQTTIQVAKNIARINNAIEKTATELSFVSTAAELARFTELSTKVKNDIEEALKKRMAFTDELKPKSDKDTTAFIAKLSEYKPNGLTADEARRAESPAAKAYCWYWLDLISLQSDGERLAEWLEGKAATLLAKIAAEQNAQKGTKPRRERAPGMADKTVASMFNNQAQPLVRRVIKNNGDEKCEYSAAVKESRDKGEKGGMIDAYGGYCIYEPKRGGDRSGYATYGNLSVDGFRKWLKTYPNAHNRHPYCGFHAGMLADPAALKTCADIWGKHCIEYARQFYEWRKIHRTAPRSQFRFKVSQTVHGAENMAATQ